MLVPFPALTHLPSPLGFCTCTLICSYPSTTRSLDNIISSSLQMSKSRSFLDIYHLIKIMILPNGRDLRGISLHTGLPHLLFVFLMVRDSAKKVGQGVKGKSLILRAHGAAKPTLYGETTSVERVEELG